MANTSKIEDVTDNVSNNGYSSGGEESNKSNKEDFNFFSNAEPEEKNIKVDIKEVHTSSAPSGMSDPIISENKLYGDEFKSIHTMSPNEIKNEKIDMLYKFRKLEGQGIRTTMNYSMTSNLEDMRTEYYKLKNKEKLKIQLSFKGKFLWLL